MLGIIALTFGGVSFGGGNPIWGVCWLIADFALLASGK